MLPRGAARSEEHTSELQSQSNLVCRLLLEKKLHRNCCRGATWKNRADSKIELSARVFRAEPQSPATIFRKGSALSFLFAVPIEDRQFGSAPRDRTLALR